MTTPIREVVQVSLLRAPPLANTDNPNAVMLVTEDQNGPLDSNNRYKAYGSPDGVAEDFGSLSKTAQHARTFFSQSPNPLDAGGSLIVGYWRSSSEDVDATAATLEGGELNTQLVIDEIRKVDDGAFDVDVDGTTVSISALDFTGITSLEDIAQVIHDALASESPSSSAEALTSSIKITSDTTGSTSSLTFLTDPDTGTFIGDLLNLTEGSGAELTQGTDSSTLDPETKVEALDALNAEVKFRGLVFIPKVSDDEVNSLASWAQSNQVLIYNVFDQATGTDYFALDTENNPAWNVTQSGYDNFRMLYRKDGDRKFATAYMARTHVVDFAFENVAMTIHLKVLRGITPESFTQTEINDAETVGLDLYVTTKQRPWVKTSGANNFTDNRYNLIAFIDSVEVDLFNFLGSAATKIPQTTPGVKSIVDRVEKTIRRYVRSGVFAPGEWLRPDYFGQREAFYRSIREKGFYVLAGDLADQSMEDRQDRVSPPIQVAVKNAGAIHKADVIVVFDI